MRQRMSWMLALVAGLVTGCFQVEDELTIQPDGSGTVRLVTHTSMAAETTSMMSMAADGGGSMYPPVNEAEAKHFFPGKVFSVTVAEESSGERQTITVTAAFKDVNTLLASPYGRAHQLALRVENGALVLRALSGGEAAARMAETKPEGEMADFGMSGLEELQKKNGEMKFSFRITLPAAVTEANGTRAGNSVTWTTERAKCKDAEEFVAKLSGTLEARCATAGLKFTPVTPPRLGLLPFKDLVVGAAATATALPDTNKIIAAVRFEPHSLSVTRSLDLSGEGATAENQAVLQGAVVVPAEFAPQHWGTAKLVEAVDSKGKDLKPAADNDENGFQGRQFRHFSGLAEDEEADSETKTETSSEQRRKISLAFKAPEWKVKEIARIKGTVELQYLGAAEVLKVSNAVPASLIMDLSKRSSFTSFGGEERGLISEPRLEAAGLSLRVQTAMTQNGMTILSVEAGGKVSVVDLQAFDAEGRPWPTTFRSESSFDENKSLQVMIAGKPKAPLALGLVVSGVGASVEVPVSVEKVPVINN